MTLVTLLAKAIADALPHAAIDQPGSRADTYSDMSGPWTVLYYSDPSGREPVREWMEQLSTRAPGEFGAVRHHIALLREFGVSLGAPYSRQLEARLRELRPGPWRITYFADEDRRMILLTSFRKRGRRTDPRQIDRARKAMLEWSARSR